MAKKISAKRKAWRSHGMIVNVPMRLHFDPPCPTSTNQRLPASLAAVRDPPKVNQ